MGRTQRTETVATAVGLIGIFGDTPQAAAALLRRNPFLLFVACWRPRVSPRAFDVAVLHWKTRKVLRKML